MSPVLVINQLSAGYGPLRVLHDLNLSVDAGERVGIAGLNGHGKSTLLNAIAGLTDWQSGSIRMNGKEIGGRRMTGPGRDTHRIARAGLALMPQGDAIFPGLTVKENLLTGAHSRAAWGQRKERLERVFEVFAQLRELQSSPVGKLSGGERRMVSLGRGLMGDASVVLIDEPSLGLAPKVAANVVAALDHIDIGEGAMIIAEQNVTLLSGRVDRMLGMHSGHLKLDVGNAFDGLEDS